MGKMKGNRLNTAANTGSFITGRQQLKAQRQIAYNTGIQAQLAQIQLQQFQSQQEAQRQAMLDVEFSKLCAWADQEVVAGRRTQENARAYVANYWHNKMTPPPTIDKLLVGSTTALLRKTMAPAGIVAGWYVESSGTTARYWDGSEWTEQVQGRQAAQDQVRIEASVTRARRKLEKSANKGAKTTAPEGSQTSQIPGINPARSAGWYPMEGEGIFRYWDGVVWTEHTHAQGSVLP